MPAKQIVRIVLGEEKTTKKVMNKQKNKNKRETSNKQKQTNRNTVSQQSTI